MESMQRILQANNPETVYLALLRADKTVLIEKFYAAHFKRELSFAAWADGQRSLPSVDGIISVVDQGDSIQFVCPIIMGTSELDLLDSDDGNEETAHELIGYVGMILSKQQMQQRINEAIQSILILTVGIVALAIIATLLLTRKITTPVNTLITATQKISQGDLTGSIEVGGRTGAVRSGGKLQCNDCPAARLERRG